jgi:hypothetical protein
MDAGVVHTARNTGRGPALGEIGWGSLGHEFETLPKHSRRSVKQTVGYMGLELRGEAWAESSPCRV